jgi:hypothetical protein
MELPKPLISLSAAHKRVGRLTSKNRQRDNAGVRHLSVEAVARAVAEGNDNRAGEFERHQGRDGLRLPLRVPLPVLNDGPKASRQSLPFDSLDKPGIERVRQGRHNDFAVTTVSKTSPSWSTARQR